MLIFLYLQMFATGSNDCGKLGLNLDSKNASQVDSFSQVQGEQFVDIAQGVNHVLAVTEKGRLYGWGSNAYNKLLITRDVQLYPTPIAHFDSMKVTSVSAGEEHTLVVADDILYAFGSNTQSQLGNNSTTLPVKPALAEKPLKVVATGYASFVLTTGGNVYFFGKCQNSMCGMPNGVYNVPTLMPLPTRAQDIFASADSFFFVGNNEKTYAIGSNRKYKLCSAAEGDVKEFFVVGGVNEVKKIAFGYDHTLFMKGGDVYACGSNAAKAFGTNDGECKQACLIKQGVDDVAATAYASMYTAAGVVYASGTQTKSETGSRQNLPTFGRVFSVADGARVFASSDYSFVVQQDAKPVAKGGFPWWGILLLVVFCAGMAGVIGYFLYAIFIKKERIFVAAVRRHEQSVAQKAMEMDVW